MEWTHYGMVSYEIGVLEMSTKRNTTKTRGGSKNFSKGGLYTILITFNANDVEVE